VARETRVRGSAPYRDLLAFTAASRQRLAEEREFAGRRDRAMEQLLRQIRIEDDAEGERLRDDLAADRREAHEAFVEAVARKRAEAKQAFRRLADFGPADAALFDRLADQELDALLKERGDF
jgi:hypothetical protein